MLGYDDDEIGDDRRRSGSTASIPTTSARVARGDRRPPRGRTPHFESEHRMRHRDGSYRWMLSRGAGRARRTAGTRRASPARRPTSPTARRRGAARCTTRSTTRSPGCPTARCSSTASSTRARARAPRPRATAAPCCSSTSTASSSSTTARPRRRRRAAASRVAGGSSAVLRAERHRRPPRRRRVHVLLDDVDSTTADAMRDRRPHPGRARRAVRVDGHELFVTREHRHRRQRDRRRHGRRRCCATPTSRCTAPRRAARARHEVFDAACTTRAVEPLQLETRAAARDRARASCASTTSRSSTCATGAI